MKISSLIFYSILLFIFLIIFPGIYYEDMTDVYLSILSKGLLTSEPVAIFNNYGAHFMIGHLYPFLHKIYPLDWYAMINILLLALAIANLFHCIFLLHGDKKKRISYLIILFLLPLILQDIIFFQFNKTSIYLLFSSIWILTRQTDKITGYVRYYNFFLFVAGLLLRPLCLLIVAALFLPSFIFSPQKKSQLASVRNFILLFGFGFIIILLSFRSYDQRDRAYADFAEYKSSVWDNGQPASSLILKSDKDSLVYECMSKYFLPEMSVITGNELKTIGIYKAHTPTEFIIVSFSEIRFKAKKAIEKWQEILGDPYLVFFYCSVLLLILFHANDKKALFRQLITVCWVFIGIIAMSVLIKMETKILYPLLILLLFVLTEHSRLIFGRNKIYTYIILLSMLAGGLKFTDTLRFSARERRTGQEEINQLTQNLSTDSSRKTIVLDWLSINVLGNSVINFNKDIYQINWITLEPAYLLFYDEYYRKNKTITGYADFPDIVKHMNSSKTDFMLLYSEDRPALLQKYCRIMHDTPLQFEQGNQHFKDSKILSGKINFHEYKIKQDGY
jgi:hypothetical protein